MDQPFTIIEPTGTPVPIVVSVPHCGINFPSEIKSHYKPELIIAPDDTDFFVHDLYRFVSGLGVTMIHANYSRWVIDLNRTANNTSLYDDGRIITSLTPTTDFFGQDIYKSKYREPDSKEIKRRKQLYYQPYYDIIQDQLYKLKDKFGVALLWDAHSIRRKVPMIQDQPFTDLILGTNDSHSAAKEIIDIALNELSKGHYDLAHNVPFKGGNITRHFGDPDNGIHALQLEMTKLLYMDDEELKYDAKRAEDIQIVLKNTLHAIISKLNEYHTT